MISTLVPQHELPWQHLGIDLNEAVHDPDLDDDLGIHLKQPVQHPVPVGDVYLNNPADQDVYLRAGRCV
jgi:hypothetical protein